MMYITRRIALRSRPRDDIIHGELPFGTDVRTSPNVSTSRAAKGGFRERERISEPGRVACRPAALSQAGAIWQKIRKRHGRARRLRHRHWIRPQQERSEGLHPGALQEARQPGNPETDAGAERRAFREETREIRSSNQRFGAMELEILPHQAQS